MLAMAFGRWLLKILLHKGFKMAKQINNYESVMALRKKLKEQEEKRNGKAAAKPATADKKPKAEPKTAEKDTK